MIVYFIPIVLCFATAFFKELPDNRRWYIVMGIYLCVFLCFGYMTGTDWKQYEFMYDNLDFNKFFYGYSAEPGYYLYMMLFKKCGVSFWAFFIFTKIIIFIIIYKALFDCCKESFWLALVYFIPWFGFYMFIDNPMRNCIAVAVFTLSVRYIIDRNFWKFFFLILIAGSFHVTALFMIPFYFVLTKNPNKYVWAVIFVVVNLFFAKRELLVDIITKVCVLIPYFRNKLITYFVLDSVFVEGKLFSFGLLWQTGLFVLMLCYKERIIDVIGDKMGLFAFNCAMVFMLFVRLGTTIPMFGRIQLYFSVYLVICIGLVVLSFDYHSRWLFACLLLAVSFYTCYDRMTSSDRYVPYTNHITYAVKGERPSYSIRYFYNYRHSPYKTDNSD